MVRTIVQLTEEQAARLERTARRRGVSKAALVREALDVVLEREGEEDPVAERALRAAGCASSGLRDLGESHDDYLAESRRW